jgi:putative membrane protein
MARPPVAVRAGTVAIGVGGTVAIALVAWFGARAIGADVVRAAWTLPPILALHGAQLWLSALAWRRATGIRRPGGSIWLRIRWIRESVNSLLPVAQVGGAVVGVRLLTQRGVGIVPAAAGTTLDMTVEALGQLLFTLAGILALAATSTDHAWRPWLGGGVAVMAAGTIGLILAQRAGLLRLVEALTRHMSRAFPALPATAAQGLHGELMRLETDHAGLLHAAGLHMLAWLLGVGETWLALSAMGHPATLAAAFVVESLGMAARSAGFLVPGALGVQEGGFMLVGNLVGLPPDAAIALSMVKRTRELLVGVPGLLAWQWLEGARLVARAKPVAERISR